MDLSNESLYELFLFLDSNELILCSLTCWNFYVLSRLESLWRSCTDREHKELFGKETWYETCKICRQMDVLCVDLKINMTIADLYTKKIIDASHRQLTALPSDIGHLTNLQQFALDHNKLTALPSEIRHLTNLRELWLQNNKLTALPSEIGHLTNLQWLCVSKSTKIPPEIQNMHRLRVTKY